VQQILLYHTAIPVLLGDGPAAGRIALELYRRYGKVGHFLGHRPGLLTRIYAKLYPFALPMTPAYDSLWIKRLLDFSKEQRHSNGLVCLIPCGPAAEAFLERARAYLESDFVLLSPVEKGEDPLLGLIRSH
jgi:hypothetical protein